MYMRWIHVIVNWTSGERTGEPCCLGNLAWGILNLMDATSHNGQHSPPLNMVPYKSLKHPSSVSSLPIMLLKTVGSLRSRKESIQPGRRYTPHLTRIANHQFGNFFSYEAKMENRWRWIFRLFINENLTKNIIPYSSELSPVFRQRYDTTDSILWQRRPETMAVE